METGIFGNADRFYMVRSFCVSKIFFIRILEYSHQSVVNWMETYLLLDIFVDPNQILCTLIFIEYYMNPLN
jgi:hypothetical protein